MMSARLPLEKLARLVPLLASAADGEALGAARATVRVLEAAGGDVHDLAAFLRDAAGGLDQGRDKDGRAEGLLASLLGALRSRLRPSELKFATGCASHFEQWGFLSRRQVETLLEIRDRIIERAEAAA